MVTFFLRIWQLPQLLIAWIIIIIGRSKVIHKVWNKDITVIYKKWFNGSMSLGPYVFTSMDNWNKDSRDIELLRGHEYGHSIQSIYLGPLYLLIIGIPSIFHAMYYVTNKPSPSNGEYYKFYTERWANKIRDRHRTYLW